MVIPPMKQEIQNPLEKVDWVQFIKTESPPPSREAERTLTFSKENERSLSPTKFEKKVKINTLLRSRSRSFLRFRKNEQKEEVQYMDWIDFLRTEAPKRNSIDGRMFDEEGFPLPDELILLIFSLMDLSEIFCISLSCKRFERLANENLLWKILYFKEGFDHVISEQQEFEDPLYWKKLFQDTAPKIGNWEEWVCGNNRKGRTKMQLIKRTIGRRQECRAFLFGLPSSGKTTILHQLQQITGSRTDGVDNIYPTEACLNEVIPYKEISFRCLDVSGVHWKNAYKCYRKAFPFMDLAILVMDASDIAGIHRLRQFVESLLKRGVLTQCPLMIWANKKDLSQNMYVVVDTVCDMLNTYRDPYGSKWYIQSCCGKTGEGLRDGINWCYEVAKNLE